MEHLIKKLRKMVHEEDQNNNNENSEEEIDSIKQENNNEEEMNPNLNKKFNESQKNFNFDSSLMKLSNKNSNNLTNINNKFSKSFSESSLQNNITNSLNKNNNSSLENLKEKSTLSIHDEMTQAISKTINYIKKYKEKSDLNTIVTYLNEILDIYINMYTNLRINDKKTNEKDYILTTKYNTAEKMVKTYELKVLTLEKEKNNIIKKYNDLVDNYDRLKEKNEKFIENKENMIRLEKNNFVLLQTNEELKKNINDIKINNNFIKKKYEEEINNIQMLLKTYQNRLYNLENKLNIDNKDINTITLNSI
jgi:hypothetical protein